jgi:hypothetical protein
MTEIECPWCKKKYSVTQVFTYIIYTCDICGGGYKRIGLKTVKVTERPPEKETRGDV